MGKSRRNQPNAVTDRAVGIAGHLHLADRSVLFVLSHVRASFPGSPPDFVNGLVDFASLPRPFILPVLQNGLDILPVANIARECLPDGILNPLRWIFRFIFFEDVRDHGGQGAKITFV